MAYRKTFYDGHRLASNVIIDETETPIPTTIEIDHVPFEVRHQLQIYRRKEEHHCEPSFHELRNALHTNMIYHTSKKQTHIAAMQLQQGKTLLARPAIKKRTPKPAPGATSGAPETQHTLPGDNIDDHGIPSDGTIHASETTPKFTGISLSTFQQAILDGYKDDVLFSKALKSYIDSGIYIRDSRDLLYTGPNRDRMCIPDIKVGGERDGAKKSLHEMLITHVHEVIGHMNVYRTNIYLRSQYYWKTMTGDIEKYIRSCHLCQMNKTVPTKQYGKNHPLPIFDRPWEFYLDGLPNQPPIISARRPEIQFIVHCSGYIHEDEPPHPHHD